MFRLRFKPGGQLMRWDFVILKRRLTHSFLDHLFETGLNTVTVLLNLLNDLTENKNENV